MSRDIQLKERWEQLVNLLSNQFSQGEDLDLDAIIYLIGVQELGKVHRTYEKDEKLNLMHIAICRLLEPYGFYEFEFFDEEGWPHYKVKEELPPLFYRKRANFIVYSHSHSFQNESTEN
jgi:hypothetical protein